MLQEFIANPHIEHPGVISGCQASINPNMGIDITPGRLVNAVGASAEVFSPRMNVCYVPTTMHKSRWDVLLCDIEDAAILFRLESNITHIKEFMSRHPISAGKGVCIAALWVPYPCNSNTDIKVYNAIPSRGELTIGRHRPLDLPDGEKTSFRLNLRVNEDFSIFVTVASVSQDHYHDFTLGTWVSDNGETLSTIEFKEPPAEGVDIVVKAYTGRIKVA